MREGGERLAPPSSREQVGIFISMDSSAPPSSRDQVQIFISMDSSAPPSSREQVGIFFKYRFGYRDYTIGVGV